jgi:putative DNA primase/helicase
MGGILQTAGIPGFFGNLAAFQDEGDSDADRWHPFVAAWWSRHGNKAVAPKDLMEMDSAEDFLSTRKNESDRGRVTRFGFVLRKTLGRVFEIVTTASLIRYQQQRLSVCRSLVVNMIALKAAKTLVIALKS